MKEKERRTQQAPGRRGACPIEDQFRAFDVSKELHSRLDDSLATEPGEMDPSMYFSMDESASEVDVSTGSGSNGADSNDYSKTVRPGGWRSQIALQLRLLTLERPWASWVMYVDMQRRVAHGAALMIRGWSKRDVRLIADRAQKASEWSQDSLHSSAETRWHTALVAQEAERRLEMAKRVLKHMLHRQLALSWSSFVHSVGYHRYARERKLQIIFRMSRRQLWAGFARFKEVVGVAVEGRHKVAKAVARWINLQAAVAFNRWGDHVAAAVDMRAMQVMEGLHKRKGSILLDFLTAWRLLTVELRFEIVTCEIVMEAGEAFRCAMSNFKEWQEATVSAVMRRHRITLYRRVVNRMLQHRLSMAWNSFKDAVRNQQCNRFVLAKVVARISLGCAHKAFQKWIEEVRESEQEHERMVNEEINRNLLDAAKRAHYATDAETARRIQLVKRVVARMLQRHLGKAFVSFIHGTTLQRRNRQRVRMCVMRMLSQRLAQAFDRYKQSVKDLANNRRLIRQVLARMRNRNVVQAFQWMVNHLQARRKNTKAVCSIVARWTKFRTAKALLTWAQVARHAGNKRGKMRRAVMRMLSQRLAQAFDRYKQSVKDLANNRRLIRQVLTRMSSRLVVQAFERFSDAVKTVVRRRRLLRSVLAKLTMSAQHRAFRRLASFVADACFRQRAVLLSMGMIATRWRRMCLFNQFCYWSDWATDAARKRISQKQASRCAGCWPRRTYFGGTLAAPCPPTTGCRHLKEVEVVSSMEANFSKETKEEPLDWSDERSIQQAFEKLCGSPNAGGGWEAEEQRKVEEEEEVEAQIRVLLDQEIEV